MNTTLSTVTLHPEAAVAVIAQSLLQCTTWNSCPPRTSGSAMALSRGLHPLLRGALVVVATEAMAMAMAIMVAVATVTQEVALLRQGDTMTPCDGDEARVYGANKAGTGATTAQLACTWAAPWGK